MREKERKNAASVSQIEYDKSEAEEGKVMAVLAYLGILWLVPLFAGKTAYLRFHANQGLVLFIAEAVFVVLDRVLWFVLVRVSLSLAAVVSTVLWIFSIVFLVLAIIGIKNAVQCQAKKLPVLGSIRILKY